MVSFWPWKGDDNSPASFEKILSTLSAKISTATGKLDSLRQRSRRLSALWTLSAGFAYLLYTIVLVLVVGWREWGPTEFSAIAAGPTIIYLVRRALSTYYDYRTSSIQGQLDELQKQRDTTIEKLKAATKYNSTQELLKKYSGTPTPKEKPSKGVNRNDSSRKEGSATPKVTRTGVVPPPTANIQGRDGLGSMQTPPVVSMTSNSQRSLSPQEEFAPNAFSAAPQYASTTEGSRWYDRIMDVLLGEDETRPGARIALICHNCRLVNGQAPPGVLRLEDLGRWRCASCGTMNGEDAEAKKIIASISKHSPIEAGHSGKERADSPGLDIRDKRHDPTYMAAGDEDEGDITQYSDGSSDQDHEVKETKKKATETIEESDTPKRRSTRARKGGKKSG